MEIINAHPLDAVREFMVGHGANPAEMADAYHLALWIEGAPGGVKYDFLNEFNSMDWPSLRICDNCGAFMDEGYLLDTQYACSDACAIALFDGDEKLLRETIGDGSGDFFWTQWY